MLVKDREKARQTKPAGASLSGEGGKVKEATFDISHGGTLRAAPTHYIYTEPCIWKLSEARDFEKIPRRVKFNN